ncbi:hypothetical protein EAG_12929 [Camponotus floridanus]|uniref:Uncharacterized protein n=1 Tax=Camponotus floridanus TaxID=104421 RepID=E2A8X1_CAMFO|nr:hypothetical protein EAG_12929 [Camponotus floridanus]
MVQMQQHPAPEIQRKKLKPNLADLEGMGKIKRTSTQHGNPFVKFDIKSNDTRLCLDDREFNKRMANEHDQSPTINKICRSNTFSEIATTRGPSIPTTSDRAVFTKMRSVFTKVRSGGIYGIRAAPRRASPSSATD